MNQRIEEEQEGNWVGMPPSIPNRGASSIGIGSTTNKRLSKLNQRSGNPSSTGLISNKMNKSKSLNKSLANIGNKGSSIEAKKFSKVVDIQNKPKIPWMGDDRSTSKAGG